MRWLGGAALALITALLLGTLVLHIGQVRHNRLEFEPDIPEAVAGERFASAIIAIVEHELGGFTGWRPNDFLLWGPSVVADNNANRQLGIIMAVRETVRVLKDHLTKVSSDPYDPKVVAAENFFRNDAERLWIPSAESRFRDGVQALREYVAGLRTTPPTSRPMNLRNIEAIRLFQMWTDMLGNAHAMLYRSEAGFTESDDLFYQAQGVAHVMFHVMRALELEYRQELAGRPILQTLFEEVIGALGPAATLKPLFILDGDPESIFANHRRNLDAYVAEARQKMYSIREELEK
jgi:hypothetical protein